ncbi:MAG: 23S rRNA (adenine(2030)-N(6))-methyltransferase RlmJ [Gammaproteobacteria bacterium]|nr:23S rRNA (adenine(2030)-N(6))-methyltransferase RlmJ [Gammaproteobacteria bacterium]
MLSYRHGFHAGNPADVFKHSVLLALLTAMQEKPGGITCIDTHAGPPVHDLTGRFANKNREYERGILPLWNAASPPAILLPYLQQIHEFNVHGELRHYPGSSLLLRQKLRPQDRLILCELHSTEQRELQLRFHRDRRVHLHHGDGYAALAELLPPGGGRGLVLIDPPYELKTELHDLQTALSVALQRFALGVYAVWYPLIEGKATTPDAMLAALQDQGLLQQQQWLDLRISFDNEQRLGRMHGCGMLIINAPRRVQPQLQALRECCQQAAWLQP